MEARHWGGRQPAEDARGHESMLARGGRRDGATAGARAEGGRRRCSTGRTVGDGGAVRQPAKGARGPWVGGAMGPRQGCGGGRSAGHGGRSRAIESAGIQSADDLEGHGRGGEAERMRQG